MTDEGEVKLLKLEAFSGPDVEAQMRAKDEEYAAAAKEQVEWERKARAEAAAWAERVEEEEEAEGSDGSDGDSLSDCPLPSPHQGTVR